MSQRRCVLEPDRFCTRCGACDQCDLDPQKICDNCMKCMETPDKKGYRSIRVGKVVLDGPSYEQWLGQDGPEKKDSE